MILLKIEIKSLLREFILWASILSSALIILMVLFPLLKMNTSQIMADNIFDFWGLREDYDFINISVYFAYIMQYIGIAIAIYSAILGLRILVKEEAKGTIGYLYAQPISRNKIVGIKLIVNIIIIFCLVIILAIVSGMLNLIFSTGNQEIVDIIQNVQLIYSGIFLSGMIFMSIGLLVSIGMHSDKKVTAFAVGIVLISEIIGVLSNLFDIIGFLKYLSPLVVFKPTIIIETGINIKAVMIWGILSIIMIFLTAFLYHKKDFKV
jgi:ABC-2 type transport system permease protein